MLLPPFESFCCGRIFDLVTFAPFGSCTIPPPSSLFLPTVPSHGPLGHRSPFHFLVPFSHLLLPHVTPPSVYLLGDHSWPTSLMWWSPSPFMYFKANLQIGQWLPGIDCMPRPHQSIIPPPQCWFCLSSRLSP